MTDSNDEGEGDFWKEDYEPSERTKEALEPEPNEVVREAAISFDGEQFYVRFPKEIAEIIKLSQDDRVRFKGLEYPDKVNEVGIELVREQGDE